MMSVGISRSVPTLLMAWASALDLVEPYSLLLEKDKTTKLEVSPFPQIAPTNAAQDQ